jgi:hypothetical protein
VGAFDIYGKYHFFSNRYFAVQVVIVIFGAFLQIKPT